MTQGTALNGVHEVHLVEKFIGTAFETVQVVANNLDTIKEAAAAGKVCEGPVDRGRVTEAVEKSCDEQATAGATGATGAQGAIGPQGPTGEDGQDGTNGAQGATGAQGAAGLDGSGSSAEDSLVLLYPLSNNVNRDVSINTTNQGLFPFSGGNPRINNTSGSGISLTNGNQTLTVTDGVFNVKLTMAFKRINTGETLLGVETVARVTTTDTPAILYLRETTEVPVGQFLDYTLHHLDFYVIGIPAVVSEAVSFSFGTFIDENHVNAVNSGIRLLAGACQLSVTKVAEAPNTYTGFASNKSDVVVFDSNGFAADFAPVIGNN